MADEKEVLIDNASRFGQYLTELRLREPKRSQSDVVAAIEKAAKAVGVDRVSLTQASLARLEGGQTPKPEVLLALAHVYQEPLDRMISAYVSIIVLGQAAPTYFSSRIGLSQDALPSERPFFASNRLEAWSLDEVLAWEATLADGPARPPSLWIISTRFLDHRDEPKHRPVSSIIVDLLAVGGNITYFVNPSDIGDHSPTDLLISKVVRGLRKKVGAANRNDIGEIGLYTLSAQERVMFTSSIVVGNPNNLKAMSDRPCGFTIVAAAGEHHFGIPLQYDEAERVVERVRNQIALRLENPRNGGWEPHALTTHRLFKQEFGNDPR